MQNMRLVMPALQKAKPVKLAESAQYAGVALPKQKRETRIVKDTPVDQIAKEIVAWLND